MSSLLAFRKLTIKAPNACDSDPQLTALAYSHNANTLKALDVHVRRINRKTTDVDVHRTKLPTMEP